MTDEPTDPAPPPADRRAASIGPWRWTVAIPDAKPEWGAMRKALRAIPPQRLFRWTHAHRLPDGTRVDEFVHRESTALVFLGEDGRAWEYSGMGPGAVGPSVLLYPGPKDQVARVLAMTACDHCLHEIRRECGRCGEPTPSVNPRRPPRG